MMEPVTVGIIGIVCLLLLLVLGIPIAFALSAVGAVGMIIVAGLPATLSQISLIAWGRGTDFVLICIPMFIFMGQIVYHTGIAADLYEVLQKWLGRLPGGLAIASVGACGGFGAVTGSSVACVATMGSIIMPEMQKYKYNERLSAGVLASSGTLGILVPPSLGFVFYGILTDTSISALFIAGIVPAIITILIFSAIIYIRCIVNPALAPRGPRSGWKERIVSVKKVWPVATIFIVVIGGLYGGFFTPTEASGVGAVGVVVVSLIQKKLNWQRFKMALDDTGVISAMIFIIIIGGYLISRFLAITDITTYLVDGVAVLNPNKYLFIFLIFLLYFILGCMMELFGMAVLTLPFLFPIVIQLGIDPVWFGVFSMIMAEIALITPPIGMNVFVMRSIADHVSMESIFIGIIPFLFAEILLLVLLVIFPEIAIWLPRLAGLM
jgi:C4-dicarboxylate transporter DctM subunit